MYLSKNKTQTILFFMIINLHGGRNRVSDSSKIAFLYNGLFHLYMTPKLDIMVISL